MKIVVESDVETILEEEDQVVHEKNHDRHE